MHTTFLIMSHVDYEGASITDSRGRFEAAVERVEELTKASQYSPDEYSVRAVSPWGGPGVEVARWRRHRVECHGGCGPKAEDGSETDLPDHPYGCPDSHDEWRRIL